MLLAARNYFYSKHFVLFSQSPLHLQLRMDESGADICHLYFLFL